MVDMIQLAHTKTESVVDNMCWSAVAGTVASLVLGKNKTSTSTATAPQAEVVDSGKEEADAALEARKKKAQQVGQSDTIMTSGTGASTSGAGTKKTLMGE